MDKDEQYRNIIDGLYPVGKERWVKVKYLDQEKAMEHIRMRSTTMGDIKEEDKALGYVVTAMGLMDEHNPQVSALMDVRGELVGGLMHVLDQQQIDLIDSLFLNKIKELKDNTIEYAQYVTETVKENQLVVDRLEDGTWRVLMGDSELQRFGNEDYHEFEALKFIYDRSVCTTKE